MTDPGATDMASTAKASDEGRVVDEQTPVDTLLGAGPRRVMRHWLSLLVLALAALGALTFFVRFVNGDDSPYYSTIVERGELVPLVSERGTVRADGELTVTAQLDGRLTWVSGKSEGPVGRGELLARINDGESRHTVEIERARLAAAQAALEGAQVTAQDTAGRLARFEAVWRRSGGRAPSLNEMEATRADAQRSELAVEAARAEVEEARLEVRNRQAALADTEVRAPISGLLIDRRARIGQFVTRGQPLFTVAEGKGPMTIEVPFSAGPLGPIKAGTSARVRLDAFPEQTLAATLSLLRITPPPLAAPPVGVFTLKSPSPQVRPGMTATVEIELPARRNVLLVPDAALAFEPASTSGRKRARIYLLSGDGEPRRVYVSVGGNDGKRTEVFANGLVPGDQVIIGWRAPAAEPAVH